MEHAHCERLSLGHVNCRGSEVLEGTNGRKDHRVMPLPFLPPGTTSYISSSSSLGPPAISVADARSASARPAMIMARNSFASPINSVPSAMRALSALKPSKSTLNLYHELPFLSWW